MILTYRLRQYTDTKQWHFEEEHGEGVPVVIKQQWATFGPWLSQTKAIHDINLFFSGVKCGFPDLKLGISPE